MVSDTSGVRYIIWEKGIGASGAPTSTAAISANRIEILRLLLTLLSSTIYHPAGESLKRVNKWATAVSTGLEKKAVLTLMCSLLNKSMNYDPIGWGLIPYNHVCFLHFYLVIARYSTKKTGYFFRFTRAPHGTLSRNARLHS
jgi:hypothetical protein